MIGSVNSAGKTDAECLLAYEVLGEMREDTKSKLVQAMDIIVPIVAKTYKITSMFGAFTLAITEPANGHTLAGTRQAEFDFLAAARYNSVDVKVLTAFAVLCVERNRELHRKKPDATAVQERGGGIHISVDDDDAGPGKKGATHAMALQFMQEFLKRFYGDKRPVMAELIKGALGDDITVDEKLRTATRAAIKSNPLNKEFALAAT